MEHATIRVPGEHDDDIDSRVLPTILRLQAERLGETPFIDVCGRTASFAGMHRLSNRLANGLRALGVNRGDRVALLLPNCFEFVALWFGIAKLARLMHGDGRLAT